VQLFGLSFGAPSSESRHDSMRDAIRNVVAGGEPGFWQCRWPAALFRGR
jgi:hypothetical protein